MTWCTRKKVGTAALALGLIAILTAIIITMTKYDWWDGNGSLKDFIGGIITVIGGFTIGVPLILLSVVLLRKDC